MSVIFDADRQVWAALMAVDGIGRQTFFHIKDFITQQRCSWGEWWHANDKEWWKKSKLTKRQIHSLCEFQQRFTPQTYFGWLREQDIGVLVYTDKNYSKLLKKQEKWPILLYTKGRVEAPMSVPIAVVGTRKISGYGRYVCEELVSQLVAEKVSVVSGFMYGVDEHAHRIASQLQGHTVGVLGYGFEQVYPADMRDLFAEILSTGGGFITEYAPHVAPSKGTFLQRNRVVAGLAEAVVVIEAGLHSGSHVTAQHAFDLDRAVCAVPGPITNPYSEGTRWLSNQGASLVRSAQDVFEAIFGGSGRSASRLRRDAGPGPHEGRAAPALTRGAFGAASQQVLELLTQHPMTINELCTQLQNSQNGKQLELSKLLSILTELELQGHIQQAGPIWSIR